MREKGNIETLKINIENQTPDNTRQHRHTPLRQFRCITIGFISLRKIKPKKTFKGSAQVVYYYLYFWF